MTSQRQNNIASLLGFSNDPLPFSWESMFKGKPKAIHFQPILDKIRVKLATWKASLPFIAGRVQMVKSVIHNRLNYSLTP